MFDRIYLLITEKLYRQKRIVHAVLCFPSFETCSISKNSLTSCFQVIYRGSSTYNHSFNDSSKFATVLKEWTHNPCLKLWPLQPPVVVWSKFKCSGSPFTFTATGTLQSPRPTTYLLHLCPLGHPEPCLLWQQTSASNSLRLHTSIHSFPASTSICSHAIHKQNVG